MNPRTKTQFRILEALERGYTVTDDGKLLSKNKELKYGLYISFLCRLFNR